MIKSVKLAAAATLMIAAAPLSAEAFPVATAPVAPAAVTLVAGGCGPAFHRGPLGGCRPNGMMVAPLVRRPVIVAPIVRRPICRTVLLPLPHRVMPLSRRRPAASRAAGHSPYRRTAPLQRGSILQKNKT